MIWDVTIQYFNVMSIMIGLEIRGKEKYWGIQIWSEFNIGPTLKIMKNPGLIKGGKLVFVTDVGFVHPRSYLHQNRCVLTKPNSNIKGLNNYS